MTQNHYWDPSAEKVLPERRSGADRRSQTALWATLTGPYHRRCSRGRRKTDRGRYVDIYDGRTWLIAIAVFILSAIDAGMTGLHMTKGTARELNPVMDAFIKYGGLNAFYGAKAAMTVIPLAIIFIHKEWMLGRFAARLCLWAYSILCCYHLYLAVLLHRT
jgi:hypothetical protein